MINTPYDIFIFAGEPSGDQIGGELITQLRKEREELSITGIGGPSMRAAKMECLLEMEQFQVVGLFPVIAKLPKILKHFFAIKKEILEKQPKLVILIDYAEFTMRLAGSLRKSGYKGLIYQYVAPTVWAWRPGRVQLMAKYFDKLFAIFPFEPDWFKQSTLPTIYVGNPVVKRVLSAQLEPISPPKEKKICLIFPGSRPHEVKSQLTRFAKLAKRLSEEDSTLYFGISLASNKLLPLILTITKEAGLEEGEHFEFFTPKASFSWMKIGELAVTKTGTISLELALAKVPTVAIYHLSWIEQFLINLFFPKKLKKQKFFCLPSIIAKKEVFKELIGKNLTEQTLYEEAKLLLNSAKAREKCRQACESVIALLGPDDAAKKVATEILEATPFK